MRQVDIDRFLDLTSGLARWLKQAGQISDAVEFEAVGLASEWAASAVVDDQGGGRGDAAPPPDPSASGLAPAGLSARSEADNRRILPDS